ncbi:anti-sigma factor antagonist [Brevibacillus ginsengisoli]|uniref:anti-sigma factor antagonist n=1 Tax=Brevibacillus ginsengisoli TaxID=363854 RepID=UPI003CF4127D
MNLSLRTKRNDKGQDVLFAGGEVDAFTAPQLKESLVSLMQQADVQVVVLDLTEVIYMDSTGVGVIIGALKTCKAKGLQLVLENVPPRIERLFRITGLTEVVTIKPLQGEKPK